MVVILIRIFLLWAAITFAANGVLSHFYLGSIAQRTFASGIEPHALRFYGYLAGFGICSYYLCRELGGLPTEIIWKVLVATVAVLGFAGVLSGLERLDQAYYRDVADFQRNLIAGSLEVSPEEVPRNLPELVPPNATPDLVAVSLPHSLRTEITVRPDGSAYQNILYWMGFGTPPVGVQVSYSPPPHQSREVEALPRNRDASPALDPGTVGTIPDSPQSEAKK